MTSRTGAHSKRARAKRHKTTPSPEKTGRSWVTPVAAAIKHSRHSSSVEHSPIAVSCALQSHKPALYLPPDITEQHPRSLLYFQRFAKAHGFKLIKNHRKVEIHPILEQRNQKPPLIALGLALLLKQLGVPGAARALSKPHRLEQGSIFIDVGQLIQMAAFAEPKSKCVVVPPNRILVNALNDNQAITGYACKLNASSITTILSHFESRHFRVIGYSTGKQFIAHICLAGGPRDQAALWTQLSTLSNADFHFQLFPGEKGNEDFGLFYMTFYLDIAGGTTPWWLTNDYQAAPPPTRDSAFDAQRKAS